MKKLLFFLFLITILIYSYKLLFYQKKIKPRTNTYVNAINNPLINWDKSWEKKSSYTSSLGGSEFNLKFSNSQKIMFSFNTSSITPKVGIEIWLDNKYFIFEHPNLLPNQTILTLTPEEANKDHILKAKIFCYVVPVQPCNFEVREIKLDSAAEILKLKSDNRKTLGVLGDSISGVLGNLNYSFLLANKINYHLLNASFDGSSMSKNMVKDATYSGITRLQSEIIVYKPDLILVFLGTNDLGQGIDLVKFHNDYTNAIKQIKKKSPKSKIVTVGLLPRIDFDSKRVEEYTSVIKTIARKENIYFVDPNKWLLPTDFADGLHPTLNAQSKIAQQFYIFLNNINLINE